MELIGVIFFAIALNLDAITAGVAYGVRGIKMPITSLLIICGISAATVIVSMLAGKVVSEFISAGDARRIGGIILFLMGLWVLYQSLSNEKHDDRDNGDQTDKPTPKTVLQIRIKTIRLIISILREPQRADMDRSGVISTNEAVLLGAALNMDALGAGFAVSMLGFNVLTTALMVSLAQMMATCTGLLIGRRVGALEVS